MVIGTYTNIPIECLIVNYYPIQKPTYIIVICCKAISLSHTIDMHRILSVDKCVIIIIYLYYLLLSVVFAIYIKTDSLVTKVAISLLEVTQ